MIIRTAFLEGTVAASDQQRFDALMLGPVLQAISSYPGIRQVQVEKLVQSDEGTPAHYMAFRLHFDSLEAMNAALASPTRQAVRTQVSQAMSLFQGRVYHQVFERL